jgi:hypothetical protein
MPPENPCTWMRRLDALTRMGGPPATDAPPMSASRFLDACANLPAIVPPGVTAADMERLAREYDAARVAEANPIDLGEL